MSMAAPSKPQNSGQTPQPSSGGYSVARAAGKCGVSGRDILPGEKLFAVVRESPTGLERIDIAPDHWAAFDKTNLLAYWQTTMPTHLAKKKVFVDDTVLCELFERLADTTEPAKLNFRFVLGLILMRKRLLAYESSRVDQNLEIWTMRFRGRQDLLDMLNPKLDEQQVAEVSNQLGEILNAE
jgi:hypothetical protein